jgi:hypothetical protein
VFRKLLIINRVRHGIEPPTPAFSIPMDLSGLELADPFETKDVNAPAIYDGLGPSGLFSTPGCSRIVPAGVTTETKGVEEVHAFRSC